MALSINSSQIPLISLLGDQQSKFKAALEAMRLQKERFFEAGLLSVDLAEDKIKNIFDTVTKDLFFFLVESKWHKTCKGHEVKVDRQLSKKEAKEKAKRAAEEIKVRENIIESSVQTKVKGKHDPYVRFKYIDNCPACSCIASKINNTIKVQVADIVSIGETLAESGQIFSHEYYKYLISYIFQNNKEC